MRFRNAAHALVVKLSEALSDGAEVEVRGSLTRELLHQHITLEQPLERTITVPHRGNDVFAAIAETVWVIAGRSDIAFLSAYLPRAIDYADNGLVWRAGYGPRIRNWMGTDQLMSVVNLLRKDPGSRRAVISLFDPASDFAPTLDVPCTNWLQPIVRDGKLDLAVAVRSNDLMWGFSGINTFEWSVLQEMLSTWLGVSPGRTHYFIGSLHVYQRHWQRAAQIVAETTPTHILPASEPAVAFTTPFDELDEVLAAWFELEQEIRDAHVEHAALDAFPDPLLRDFLWMLEARWASRRGDTGGTEQAFAAIADLSLVAAARAQLTGAAPGHAAPIPLGDLVRSTHRDKSAMYGDSWKRRGEQMSIMANLARKHDRLKIWQDRGAGGSEHVGDTVLDLTIYAIKYATWVRDQTGEPPPSGAGSWSDGVTGFDFLLGQLPNAGLAPHMSEAVAAVFGAFDALERSIDADDTLVLRAPLVDALVEAAWELLRAMAGTAVLVPAYGLTLGAAHNEGSDRL